MISNCRFLNIFFSIKTMLILILSPVLLLIVNVSTIAAVKCPDPKITCIEEGGTKYFDNVPVILDCWKYSVVYECKEESDNNCQELRDQGCSQVDARCKTMLNNLCVVQNAVYKCPIEKCDIAKNINCAKNLFCVGGNCAPTSSAKNNNFDKAASSLAALAEVAKEVKKQNTGTPIIFTGKSMECSENIAGSKKCCGSSAEGWAEGILSSCDAEEKELAKAKGAGRDIYIGEYCYARNLGVCTSHHKVYCVFDSKIARIVQNDGRNHQLGIGFGGTKNSNCRGITVEELSQLDFKKINFSDFYNEIGKKDFKKVYNDIKSRTTIPNEEKIKQKASSVSPDELADRSIKRVSVSNEDVLGLKVAERIKGFYSDRKK